MNASFSVLQKLKNQFFQTVPNKNDYHVAFAPFAFSISNDDFYFLKNTISTGDEAKKYLREQSEFANIANSILKKPNLWAIDPENLLYNKYKEILQTAQLIDPSSLTEEENTILNNAKMLLFSADDNDSAQYSVYKSYQNKITEIEKKILDLESYKNTIDTSDALALKKWDIDFDTLDTEKKSLLIEWHAKGFKTLIDTAKSTYENIVFRKSDFLKEWNDAKNIKLSANLLTDIDGVEFLSTTCIPNSICDNLSTIWKKITLDKTEINQLAQIYTQEIPPDVINEFGNLQVELETISFEYCIIDIQRPWFEESIINNSFWKYEDTTKIVSSGDDTFSGEIPAYPEKIILTKNTELFFTPNSPVNEDIKNKLKNGTRLFFGSLLLKTIPLNLGNESIHSYRIQQLTNKELLTISKINEETPTNLSKIDTKSKIQLIQAINNQSQLKLRKRIEEKSSKPLINNILIKEVNLSSIYAKKLIKEEPQTNPIETKRLSFNPFLTKANSLRSKIADLKVVTSAIPTPNETTAPTLFKIFGKTVDVNNNPLSVVEIQIMKDLTAVAQSVLTLEDGSYNIDNLENGKYLIKVRKSTYVILEREIELQGNIQLDFLLEKEPIPTESFQIMGVICKKLPKLPNPIQGVKYI